MPAPDRSLLTQAETSTLLRTHLRTLERWRMDGSGPRFVKLGRQVLYERDELAEHIRRNRREFTGDKTGGK